MIHGIINIHKEKGYTSHDVVAKLRGIVGQKKIGHTGTLDPDATGVLPVCFGKATKLCDMLTDKDKTYETVMLLGKTTDTQDITGTVIAEQPFEHLNSEIVKEKVLSFVGDYQQVPPMYSALKVNGKKLYELAREGIEIERKARPVSIFAIDILEVRLPRVKMRVSCSKGTYIRTLCHDIGQALGCGAIMQSLVRTKSGRFDIKDSVTFEDFEVSPEKYIISPDMLFDNLPEYIANEEETKKIKNGIRIKINSENGINYRVYSNKGDFLALSYSENNKLIMKTAFFG